MSAIFEWAGSRGSVGRPLGSVFEWLGGAGGGALGLPPIPWNDCWDPPGGRGKGGFNDCADLALEDAQRDCRNYNPNRYNSQSDCETQTKNVYVNARCLKFCGATPVAYRGGDPCNSTTAIMYAQQKLGVASDGAWGSKSQAALLKSGNTFQGLIGCTGDCPASVPAGSCTGDCQAGFEIDPTTGLCKASGPVGCPGGKEYVNGKCIDVCAEGLSRNTTTGDCELPACPEGLVRNTPDGPCVAPTPTGGGGKRGSTVGVVLLAVAALAAIGAAIAGRGGVS